MNNRARRQANVRSTTLATVAGYYSPIQQVLVRAFRTVAVREERDVLQGTVEAYWILAVPKRTYVIRANATGLRC